MVFQLRSGCWEERRQSPRLGGLLPYSSYSIPPPGGPWLGWGWEWWERCSLHWCWGWWEWRCGRHKGGPAAMMTGRVWFSLA